MKAIRAVDTTAIGPRIEWQSLEDASTVFRLEGHEVGATLSCADEQLQFNDEFALVEAGVVRWIRSFVLQTDAFEVTDLPMDFQTAARPDFYLIPGVNYNGNGWGAGDEPKGLGSNGEPWSFSWHRTSVAGASYSESAGISVALMGEPPRGSSGFSCSLAPSPDGRLIHRLLWPEREQPVVYRARDEYGEGFRAAPVAAPGGSFTAVAYLVFGRVERPRTGWRRMLDLAWRMHAGPVEPRRTTEEIWRLGIAYATESLWMEEADFSGFSIGLMWIDGSWCNRRLYEVGWCGQNASLANSMLAEYLRSGDPDSLRRGVAVLDWWTTTARLPNGLIRCHIDRDDPIYYKANQDGIQDACNLGTAALNFFEAADLAKACGLERPSYSIAALGICDFAVTAQSNDGRIGKSWNDDGAPRDSDGTVGCFLVPPLVEAYRRTGLTRYLEAAERAFRFYLAELSENGYTTAGALDTSCVDKESAIPLLRAGLALFDVTRNRAHLESAELAAWYLSTWQWHHTVTYPDDSALTQIGYDTFGGTAVSTQHHHIDAYALAYVPELLELASLTDNRRWAERARAIWANASIGISGGDLRLMGKPRPVGSQDEGFYQTRWNDSFNVSQWLVAWPGAFRLETLRRLSRDDAELLEPRSGPDATIAAH